MMCISEAYLDSCFLDDDSRLNLPGYNLVRSDNLNSTTKGSVCIYFKKSLAVRSLGVSFIRGFYSK